MKCDRCNGDGGSFQEKGPLNGALGTVLCNKCVFTDVATGVGGVIAFMLFVGYLFCGAERWAAGLAVGICVILFLLHWCTRGEERRTAPTTHRTKQSGKLPPDLAAVAALLPKPMPPSALTATADETQRLYSHLFAASGSEERALRFFLHARSRFPGISITGALERAIEFCTRTKEARIQAEVQRVFANLIWALGGNADKAKQLVREEAQRRPGKSPHEVVQAAFERLEAKQQVILNAKVPDRSPPGFQLPAPYKPQEDAETA